MLLETSTVIRGNQGKEACTLEQADPGFESSVRNGGTDEWLGDRFSFFLFTFWHYVIPYYSMYDILDPSGEANCFIPI